MATNGFEQSELEVPRDGLRAAAAEVHVASPDGRSIRGWNKTDWGRMAPADLKLADVDPGDYDALVIPGGQINPDLLRVRSEEHTSELQSLMRISYAVFCLKKKNKQTINT